MCDGMTREEVIKGLKYCTEQSPDCAADCPYINARHTWMTCTDVLMTDALALLKAQEPVQPTIDIRHGKSMWRCGSCSTALQPNQMHAKFCFNCGRAVKWE